MVRKILCRSTSIANASDSPFQRIQDFTSFDIKQYYCGNDELTEVISTFVQPFDLAKGPLIRVGLLETASGSYYLLTDLHHIITDGVSQGFLVNEFMTLYNGGSLPELILQYKDYAEWQQGAAQQEEIARQKAYWLNAFAEPSPVLELPTDHPRPMVSSHKGGSIDFKLEKQELVRLRQLANEQGTTMYMVVLSLFNVLLSKLSNQEDIVVGTLTAGRSHPDVEEMIGMFVNTLALRSYPTGGQSFTDFLTSVSKTTVSAFDNQSYPYEDLVDELKLTRDTSRNPLFDIMFSWQNFEESSLTMSNVEVSQVATGIEVSKFDMTLTALEYDDRINLGFQYAADLFEEDTIAQFVSYFHRIVKAVATDATIRLAEISILSDTEKHQLLVDFNDTKSVFGYDTVLAGFAKQVKLTPQGIAMTHHDRQVTYADVDKYSDQVAAYLQTREGVQSGDVVALMADRSPEVIIGMIGILKSGAAYVPVDPLQPVLRVQHMLNDCGTKILLTTVTTIAKLPEQVRELSVGSCLNAQVVSQETTVVKQSDLAYVIYTS
ncbi:MAG: condensation domain-containing protein, partial [Bacteroidota bacterium]